MYKPIVIAALTSIAAIFAVAPSTRAELAKDINPATIQQIEQATNNRNTSNNNYGSNQRQIATNSQQSMRYVQQGWIQQKRGNARQALFYYYQAVKADKSNAYAFLAAGSLLGNTREGVNCMKAAATLFRAQGNQQGYSLAVGWLEEQGIE